MSTGIEAKVLVVGVGGLGVPAGLALARLGVRYLALLDPDQVELSNLPRQIVFSAADLGRSKAQAAASRLTAQFPGLNVEARVGRFAPDNALALVAEHDFIIDGTDDPAAKFLINDACVAGGRPLAYGGVLGFFGQAMTIIPRHSACLRCVFETPPAAAEVASCREAGILGPVAGLIGTVQAREAATWLAGEGSALMGQILTYDGRTGRLRATAVRPRAGCRCGARPHPAPSAGV